MEVCGAAKQTPGGSVRERIRPASCPARPLLPEACWGLSLPSPGRGSRSVLSPNSSHGSTRGLGQCLPAACGHTPAGGAEAILVAVPLPSAAGGRCETGMRALWPGGQVARAQCPWAVSLCSSAPPPRSSVHSPVCSPRPAAQPSPSVSVAPLSEPPELGPGGREGARAGARCVSSLHRTLTRAGIRLLPPGMCQQLPRLRVL